jgi:hypothetical protein
MASTSNSSRKSKVKKSVSGKVKEQDDIKEANEVPEFPMYLDPSHLLQIETTVRDIENAKLYMHVEEQALKNMVLEKILLDQKIEKQKMLVQDKSDQYTKLKLSFENVKKDLFKVYGFKEGAGMGYNPVTGEIHK